MTKPIAPAVPGRFMVRMAGEPLHRRHVAALGCLIDAVGFRFVAR